jgi:hypothetical protein
MVSFCPGQNHTSKQICAHEGRNTSEFKTHIFKLLSLRMKNVSFKVTVLCVCACMHMCMCVCVWREGESAFTGHHQSIYCQ